MCVRVRVCARVCVCVCVDGWMCLRACVYMYVCVWVTRKLLLAPLSVQSEQKSLQMIFSLFSTESMAASMLSVGYQWVSTLSSGLNYVSRTTDMMVTLILVPFWCQSPTGLKLPYPSG